MLALNNVGVLFGAEVLLEGVTLQINPKERIALAGRNGAGKTTLLNIIAGKRAPSVGSVAYTNGMTIGYLPQHMLVHDECTVLEEARTAFKKEIEIQQQVEQLTATLAERTDYESDAYLELVQRLANATELMALYQPERQMAELEKTLRGLGFTHDDLARPTSEFSGGWRMRIELAKILLSRPDLILLDEPTNHLDMESIIWLEEFLCRSSAAVVLVSHDRRFLDHTTTRTVELVMGQAHDYRTNYSHYEELRQERYQQQLRAYENQQKQIEETEAFIERFRYKATKAVQVQSRIKQLEKMERIEVEELDRRQIHFSFPTTRPSGAYPLVIKNLGVAYGEHKVLEGVELTVERGDKIALVGKNGSGKTTFVRAIMEQIAYTGEIKRGHQLEITYFAQNQAALLNPEKSIYQTVDDVATGEVRLRINDILGAFMFGGATAEKKVAVLSGGERSRLALILLLLSPSNLLILDEPTNHLDLVSKAVLKEAIAKYEGTVLMVSHDRDFLDGLADKVFEFHNGTVTNHLGGLHNYIRKLEERTNEEEATEATAATNEPTTSAGREEYEKRKEAQRLLRQREQQVARLEAQIAEEEAAIANIEQQLATTSTPQLLNDYTHHSTKLQQLMEEWLSLAES